MGDIRCSTPEEDERNADLQKAWTQGLSDAKEGVWSCNRYGDKAMEAAYQDGHDAYEKK